MKDDFSAYPEILFIDATYQLTELRFPCFFFMVEDSLGLTEVVGVGLLVNETKESLKWLAENFRKKNDVKNLKLVMTDKDMTERVVFKETFRVQMMICLFHTLRSFKREMAKLDDSCEEVKEIFQKMCYSKNDEEYLKLRSNFDKVASDKVLKYFYKNWDPIKSEWVMCDKFGAGNFLNSTNNRVESFNSKVKTVLDHHCSLESFVSGFFQVLNCLRNERNHKAVLQYQKVKINDFAKYSVQSKYETLLTSYALSFVLENIKKSEKVSLENQAGFYLSKSSVGTVNVTPSSCTCLFSKSMLLPCEHLFRCRKEENLNLYEDTLCAQRWTKKYYRTKQRMFTEPVNEGNKAVSFDKMASRKLSNFNKNERYRNANDVCRQLPGLAAEVSGDAYVDRIKILDKLCCAWQNNEEVILESKHSKWVTFLMMIEINSFQDIFLILHKILHLIFISFY